MGAGGADLLSSLAHLVLMAEIDETEKEWPHNSSGIVLTLRVETPCTYISAKVATRARSER